MLEMDDHQQTMCIEEQRAIAEPIKEPEEVTLDESKPERTTRMGTLSSRTVWQAFTTFLKENEDVFTWSHEDMPGIDPSIIVHRLNVSPSSPLILQRKQVFAQERDKPIAEKVQKLLDADFIREVYYPN